VQSRQGNIRLNSQYSSVPPRGHSEHATIRFRSTRSLWASRSVHKFHSQDSRVHLGLPTMYLRNLRVVDEELKSLVF